MDDIEVHIDLAGRMRFVGLLRGNRVRGGETLTFEYAEPWLKDRGAFALEPALPLSRGTVAPAAGLPVFGSIGDTAPDTWGRQLMRRQERQTARREGRAVRTPTESDCLLGVADAVRLGALRFRRSGGAEFEAPAHDGVPPLTQLGRLLQVTERVLRDEETEADLALIFAPGSSLGGARPKASVVDQHGALSIAKFPRETDDYSIETWEAVAFRLAERSGIPVPEHRLVTVAGKAVLVSRRFDRVGDRRLPYLSAMAMTGSKDGDAGSYPDLVDVMAAAGDGVAEDAAALFRRMVFNVLISNVDDHLRNHGFLRVGGCGWRLSPAFDLNPTPTDVKARILSTTITLDDGTCSLDLVEEAAPYFGLGPAAARAIMKEVATATATWQETAHSLGARAAEVARMESAFEHGDLRRALAL